MHALPVLPVHDLPAAVAFHRGLGLEVVAYDDGYAWVRHDGHEVWHLSLVAGLDPADNHACAYVFVEDVDALHAHVAGLGVAISPLRDEPWGMREFSLHDPSGNTLRIGCHVSRSD